MELIQNGRMSAPSPVRIRYSDVTGSNPYYSAKQLKENVSKPVGGERSVDTTSVTVNHPVAQRFNICSTKI